MKASSAFWLGMIALSVLAILDVWIVAYLPTNDGPQAIFSAHIENHYADPGSIYAATLVPSPQFAYRGFDALYAPLEGFFGWRDALRIALCVVVLGFAWSFAAAVLALEPKRRAAAYLGFVVAWMWPLYMGFFAFVIGTSIGLGALAIALRAKTFDVRTNAIVTVVLIVGAVAHVFTAVLAWAVLFVMLVARAEPSERVRTGLRLLVPAVVPVAVLALAATLHDVNTNELHYVPFATRMHAVTRLLAPGPSWRAWSFVVVLASAIALAVARRRTLRREERAALATGLAFLVLALVAPRDIKNWEFFSPRFFPLGAALVFLAAPFELVSASAAPAFSFATLALVATAGFNRDLARGCGDALGGLAVPIERHGINMPINLSSYCGVSADPETSEVPYMAPLHHVGALYATAQGGSTPWLFIGSAAAHGFRARPGGIKVPVPDRKHYAPILRSPRFHVDDAYRRSILLELYATAAPSEGVILAGAEPRDLALLRDQGFALDYARGSFALGHFEPCRFEVTMPASDAERPIRIEAGSGDLPLVIAAIENVPPRIDGERAHFDVARGPCGAIWVRVRAVAERDGKLVETSCTNAGAGGRLEAHVPRTGASIACEGIRE
ncbi:MAG TPA: hypothetical protein VIF62_06065 [Labilithrix sp.]